MNKKRPVYLDLTKFDFPLPAVASGFHRLTGLALFFGVAFFFWAFDLSLSGEEGFNEVKSVLQGFTAKLILWVIISALLYHFVAGIKHLLMDVGIGETLESCRLLAQTTLVVSIVLIILAGVWIW